MKRGTRAIAKAKLETFKNPYPNRDYIVSFDCPEYTSVCPMTGFPDFGTLHIRYIPDRFCIELKSLKLYINSYRDQGIFHESAVNKVLDDFVAACDPRWVEVIGDFNVRGNIKTVVSASHTKSGPKSEPRTKSRPRA
ncbi:MAG: preQ(1) synthase [Acidobacteriota bacterium]